MIKQTIMSKKELTTAFKKVKLSVEQLKTILGAKKTKRKKQNKKRCSKKKFCWKYDKKYKDWEKIYFK